MLKYALLLASALLAGCAVAAMEPCNAEIRYRGKVEVWNVVCWHEGGANPCLVWPVPPAAPDSLRLGDFWHMWTHGQLEQVEVCRNLPRSET